MPPSSLTLSPDPAKRIGGQEPQSLEDFAREHREAFTGKLQSAEAAPV